MKKTRDIYAIKINCKKYVQRYLIMKYSAHISSRPVLVDISKDDELKTFLTRAVKTPSHRRDSMSGQNSSRNSKIEILISEDMFNRYGHELTSTDEVRLNSILESRCKSEMLMFLSLQYAIHQSLETAINSFYRNYGYNENNWPSGTIRKIWSRKMKSEKISLKEELNQSLTKIFMGIMSQNKDTLPFLA